MSLNHEGAAEEKRGLTRWLRPTYQAPAPNETQPWPEAFAVRFGKKSLKRTQQITGILETLKALGQ